MSFETIKYSAGTLKTFEKSFGYDSFEKSKIFFSSFTHNAPSIKNDNKFISSIGAHSYLQNVGFEKAMTEKIISNSIFEKFMKDEQFYISNPQENSLPKYLRNQIKDKYGINISENPTEEEGLKTLGVIMKDILFTTESILSRQKSANLKFEKQLKEIEEIQKNW